MHRGRMGQYEVSDFVLLLNSYAISGEKTLKAFYQASDSTGQSSADECVGEIEMSRSLNDESILAVIDRASVEALRGWFEGDVERQSLREMSGIGLFDRGQDHSVVFDIDGTVCATRQRWIAEDQEEYPVGRRRKRGEVTRTRTVIAQGQTSEWVGTYGECGNGEVKGDLERGRCAIERYLVAQGLNVAHGLVRLDGLYGTASLVSVVQRQGLGYILRSRDYHLLKHPVVQQRLQAAAAWEWQATGGTDFSEVLNVGYLEDGGRGYAAPMRLIVMRTPEKLHGGTVGKRVKKSVYELFLTSHSGVSLGAIDVLSVYRGRGGFEQRLSQEDQEQDYDRWCSWQAQGQEFWQILGQWSWNWRLWVGWHQQEQPRIRQTIWAEGEESDGLSVGDRSASQSEIELTPSLAFLSRSKLVGGDGNASESSGEPTASQVEYGSMEISTEWGQGMKAANRFGNDDFKIVDEATVLCPAGEVMSCRSQTQKENGDLAMQFGIKARTCQRCRVKRRCLALNSSGRSGRRVTVIRKSRVQAKTPVETCSALVRSVLAWLIGKQIDVEQPVFWCDVAATRWQAIATAQRL